MASIRRIMSQDGTEADKTPPTATATPEALPGDPVPNIDVDPPADEDPPLLLTTPAEGKNGAPDDHDVLLLTEPLDPVPGTADDKAGTTPEASPDIATDTETPPNADQRVASPLAEAAVAAALTRLTSQSLQQAHTESAGDPGRAILEKVIRDALRPALRSWLDENLPPIVETIVEREVARLMQERKPS